MSEAMGELREAGGSRVERVRSCAECACEIRNVARVLRDCGYDQTQLGARLAESVDDHLSKNAPQILRKHGFHVVSLGAIMMRAGAVLANLADGTTVEEPAIVPVEDEEEEG